MKRTLIALVAAGILIPSLLIAQSIPLATLTGKVSSGGTPLPGVTVTVSSPNLQGTRSAVTTENGDYLFPLLPPGQYTATYELSGMQTVTRVASLSAARAERLDIEIGPVSLSESITVTAESSATAAVESTQVSTNFKQDFIEKLPVQRNLEAVTLLAPGVTDNGPGDNIMISGAMSFDSLYLVNGAIVNENLRGQAHDLFIEDAIQETTVLTGGISAEYGHFTGGVVSAITKSGGNDLKGSLRSSLTNESWVSETPLTIEQSDKINPIYEATIGGPFFRDRLWFFGAGRFFESAVLDQTEPGPARTGDMNVVPITFTNGNEERRLEGKLTGAITPRHNIVLSYIDIAETETNQTGQTIMDLDSLVKERETPNTLLAANYSGALTTRFFVEGQYSKKEFAFLGSGSPFYDLIKGTLIQDRARDTRYWSPTFKKTAKGEHRDTESYFVKGTWFWSTPSFGSHDIKLGYEDFSEVRNVNNFGSGSDYRISARDTIIRGNQIFPRFTGGATSTLTRIIWNPILVESKGSDYATKSIFLNDSWTLNNHLSFNLGVRYDKNDAISGDHTFQIADDSNISPRLAAHYDLFGNGRLMANVSYGQYVGRLAEGVGNDADPAGRTASFQWNYRGPSINNDVNAPTDSLIPTDRALQMVFDWFFANGGPNLRPYRSVAIPGVDTVLEPGGLVSPNVKEWTAGLGGAMGTRGYARADVIFRNWDDFYTAFRDGSTGKINDEFGNQFDRTVIRNSDIYEREYTGVQTQFSYRFFKALNLGGTYTWSRLVGNVTGETSGDGPTTGVAGRNPEYRQARWNYPMGYLTGDQRHRAKVWASYDIPTFNVGELNVSLLQTYDAGTRTSADGTIDPSPYVNNPGYLVPPTAVDYFFGGRGTLSTDDITRTDLALNFGVSLLGRKLQLFLQPEVINLFGEQGVVSFNEEVLTNSDETYLKAFNPFTETPIECPQGSPAATCQQMGAHWQKGENFGEPESESSYQTPRTFRVSVGLRF